LRVQQAKTPRERSVEGSCWRSESRIQIAVGSNSRRTQIASGWLKDTSKVSPECLQAVFKLIALQEQSRWAGRRTWTDKMLLKIPARLNEPSGSLAVPTSRPGATQRFFIIILAILVKQYQVAYRSTQSIQSALQSTV
jgi:hypothetical protein